MASWFAERKIDGSVRIVVEIRHREGRRTDLCAGQHNHKLGVPRPWLIPPPDPPIKERDDRKLLEDLCIALRNVGVWDSELPRGDTIRSYIEETKMIHDELKRRGVDVDTRVSQLSDESGWLMGELLKDCLDFPKTLPYVKEVDGVRRYFRCWLCAEREFTRDAKRFLLCEECLHKLLRDIKERVPSKGVMLYRTYNQEKRCLYATSDAVLATLEQNFDIFSGFCEQCILEELEQMKHQEQEST